MDPLAWSERASRSLDLQIRHALEDCNPMETCRQLTETNTHLIKHCSRTLKSKIEILAALKRSANFFLGHGSLQGQGPLFEFPEGQKEKRRGGAKKRADPRTSGPARWKGTGLSEALSSHRAKNPFATTPSALEL